MAQYELDVARLIGKRSATAGMRPVMGSEGFRLVGDDRAELREQIIQKDALIEQLRHELLQLKAEKAGTLKALEIVNNEKTSAKSKVTIASQLERTKLQSHALKAGFEKNRQDLQVARTSIAGLQEAMKAITALSSGGTCDAATVSSQGNKSKKPVASPDSEIIPKPKKLAAVADGDTPTIPKLTSVRFVDFHDDS